MAASKAETDGAFEPCVWGDFFVTYTPPISQACMHIHKRRSIHLRSFMTILIWQHV